MNFLKGYKTYLGITIGILTGVAASVGAEVPDNLPQWADTAVIVLSGLLGIFGRYAKERRAPEGN